MADLLNIQWWGWIVFGITLALLELAVPGGFYFIFFGVSAVIVGALAWLNVLTEPWLQTTFFSIFAILGSLLLRKPLLARFGAKMPNMPVDSIVGQMATALDDIQANAFGKVELRGAAWNAKNSGTSSVARGQRCIVERVDGLSLWVRTE